MDQRMIGVIGCGVGVMHLVNGLKKIHPSETFEVLIDCLNTPYGDKTPQTILNLINQIIKWVNQQNFKVLIIGCHTMSLYLDYFKKNIHIPIIDVTYELIYQAATLSKNKKVCLLVSDLELRTKTYLKLLQSLNCEGYLSYASYTSKYYEYGDVSNLNGEAFGLQAVGIAKRNNCDVVCHATVHSLILEDYMKHYYKGTYVNNIILCANKLNDVLMVNQLMNANNKGEVIIYTTEDETITKKLLFFVDFDYQLIKIKLTK